MRNFQASSVEKRITVKGTCFSQPMEAGWASDAIFFLWIEEAANVQEPLHVSVQISADGMNWIDEGTTLEGVQTTGHYFVKAKHFGNWLRLAIKANETAILKLSVYLHLKD